MYFDLILVKQELTPPNNGLVDHGFLNATIFKTMSPKSENIDLHAEIKILVDLFLKKFDASTSQSQTIIGMKHFNSRPAESVKWFTIAAENSDPVAQYNLSYCYLHGKGTAKDLKMFIKWVESSADNGQAFAQNDLGLCYYRGFCVEKDYSLAIKYLTLSAEQDTPIAKYNLGQLFENGGSSMKANMELAIDWYKKASVQKCLQAVVRIGKIYLEGKYLDHDPFKASIYFKLAAKGNNLSGCFELSNLYHCGTGVNKNEEKARYWLKFAAIKGHFQSIVLVAESFYNSFDYQKALMWYKKSARRGHPESLYKIAKIYYERKVVNVTDSSAYYYFSKAAEKGHAEAMYYQAIMILDSQVQLESSLDPIKLLKSGADLGSVKAQSRLGNMYRFGHWVGLNISEAITWHTLASESGSLESKTQLAIIYVSLFEDETISPSEREIILKKAVTLLQEAVKRGHAEALFQLASLYRLGKGVPQSQKISCGLLQGAAKSSHIQSMVSLALCYLHGNGIKKSESECFKLLLRAAALQDPEALHLLATLHYEGLGIYKNLHRAVDYYRKAASLGYGPSQFGVGRSYLTGEGVPQHIGHAVSYLKKAADSGYAPAQTLLGNILITGRGVDEDPTFAFQLFQGAAEQNDTVAINQLGLCYFQGRGCDVNINEAIRWFTLGSNLGYEPCTRNLKTISESNDDFCSNLYKYQIYL